MIILSTGTAETVDVRNITVGADGYQLRVDGTTKSWENTGSYARKVWGKIVVADSTATTAYTLRMYTGYLATWAAAKVMVSLDIVIPKAGGHFIIGPGVVDTTDFVFLSLEDTGDTDASVDAHGIIYEEFALNSTTGSPTVSVGDIGGATPRTDAELSALCGGRRP